jgi:hypothetical protein
MLIDSSEVHHSRDVYMFLFVLADFGGVQLILTVIVAFITEFANDRKSMHSILKKFFYIKARDPTMLDPAGKNTTMANDIYKWKF